MKTQLLLTFGVILCSLTASLALRSETVTKKTNCTVVDNTAKQEIFKNSSVLLLNSMMRF